MTKLLFLVWALEDFMLPCMTKKLFGFDCPGCGLQRSAAFLLRGDFIASAQMYPGMVTLIPLALVLFLNLFVKIKHANSIINTLMISSVALILGNFFLKIFN